MKIEYITSNQKKFEEAQHILSDFELERVDFDLREIQGSRFEVIAAKAKEALAILNRCLIVEDVSLCCPAIGGLPGPYVKDFLKAIGDRGIFELIHKYEDHSVQVICIAAYIAPGLEPVLFEGIVEGKIVAPRGQTRHGVYSWNPIVQPNGWDKTYGEMSIVEHSKISMRSIALNKLKNYLKFAH
jgi:inosine triphosphate pyrophosphatase